VTTFTDNGAPISTLRVRGLVSLGSAGVKHGPLRVCPECGRGLDLWKVNGSGQLSVASVYRWEQGHARSTRNGDFSPL